MKPIWEGKHCYCGRPAVAFEMNAPVCAHCRSIEQWFYAKKHVGHNVQASDRELIDKYNTIHPDPLEMWKHSRKLCTH